jgi:hypothetical protein
MIRDEKNFGSGSGTWDEKKYGSVSWIRDKTSRIRNTFSDTAQFENNNSMIPVPVPYTVKNYFFFQAVATTCLSFPQNDVNNFIVGSEEGTLYTACRHGSRAGILDLFEGHQVRPLQS